MPAHRLHNPAAILLALVYLTVGAMGDSLHRIAEQGWASSRPSPGHRHGYFHCHAPDVQWHFHGHTAPEGQATDVNASGSGVSFHRTVATHSQHACPLLSLSSVLKIGFATASSRRPAPRPTIVLSADRDARVSCSSARLRLPRGPPADRLA